MREKIALVAFLVLAVSAAANVTLSYGECKSVENDSYCAPGEPALNLTSAYQSCIADSNARIDNLSAGLTVFSGLNASDLLACNADKEVAIALEKEAAETVARLGEGSMRDAESILGRVVAVERGNITLKTLEEFLGLPRKELVRACVSAVSEKNPRAGNGS